MVYGSTRVQNRTPCLPAKKVALCRRAIYYRAQYLSRRRSSDIQTPIKVVRVITDTYNQPNKTPQEIEAMINDGSVDILLSFSEACREKFEQSLQICSVRSLGECAHRNSPVVNATSFNRYKQSPERTIHRPMIKIRGGRVQQLTIPNRHESF
jgi:hypothetical protein